MEIKYFRLIKTIVEEGSIANSAEKLFLTQSALSHQLRELEGQLGFKVFLRTRNRWVLTDEGKVLYDLSHSVLKRIEAGFNSIKQLQMGSAGTVRVSTECYSFYQGFSAFIQKMGLLYPDIHVDLILEATHKPILKLRSNDIDIAIVTSKSDHEDLTYIDVFEDEIFAVLHHEHPLQAETFLEAYHFEELHVIIHSLPLETVSVYEQFLKPNNVKPLKISAIPLTEVALEMVNANMGIMCMPKWALKAFKLSENLTFKRIGAAGLKRTHYLVCRKTERSKKYINDFILNFIDDFSTL
jgi:LysR family transcriptional regulator for metE and metH